MLNDNDEDIIINQETIFSNLDDQTDNMENNKIIETENENEKTTKKVTFQEVGDQTDQINKNNQMIGDDDDDNEDTLATGTTDNNNNTNLNQNKIAKAYDEMKLLI